MSRMVPLLVVGILAVAAACRASTPPPSIRPTCTQAQRIWTRGRGAVGSRLPAAYLDRIRATPGVRVATSFYLFQAEAPSGKGPVAGEAIDDTTYFHVYGELPIARSDVERFAADPRGALVSKALADRLQLHVGDQLVLSGVLYPGEWRFDVLAVYPDSSERGFFYFHEGQLREHPTASALYDGRVGDIMACVDDPARAGEVQHSIQRALGEPDGPTETLYTWPAYAPDAGGTWGPK